MKRIGWWIAFAVLTAAAVLFTVFNLGATAIDIGLWSGPVPVFAVVLASLLVGFMAGVCVAWGVGHRRRRQLREHANRNAALLHQIDELRREQAAQSHHKVIDTVQSNRTKLVVGL
jgi:ABC-type bacteriocin/lantibiotic exporter with double-glycine peptidase domain